MQTAPSSEFKINFVYKDEIICNGQLNDIHASILKLFRVSEIDEAAVMSHVLRSKIGMCIFFLLCSKTFLTVYMSASAGKDFATKRDKKSLMPIARETKEVPQLFEKLLQDKCISVSLIARACAAFAL